MDGYPAYMVNRELSWLKFNERVLEEAVCRETPVLTRLQFVSIFSTNLDEFFMVRVGSLTDYMHFAPDYIDNKTGMNAKEQLNAIYTASRVLCERKDEVYREVINELSALGVSLLSYMELTKDEKKAAGEYFNREVRPLLSPQIIDPRHPFPFIANKSLNIAVELEQDGNRLCGIIPLPGGVRRLFFPDRGRLCCISLEELILHYANEVFELYKVVSKAVFSVTRNADIDTDARELDEDDDYRQHMKKILKKRQRLSPVRLEVQGNLKKKTLEFLKDKLGLSEKQVFFTSAPMDLSFVGEIEKHLTPEQKQRMLLPAYHPCPSASIRLKESVLSQVSRRDILLSYPYESMQPFLQLIREAANDESVLSIRITLYRIARQSKLAESLIEAAENGKEVTVLMELRARFDEENNIEWAQRLEEAGCRVIYGLDGFKVHSKICLITRKVAGKILTITQIGTGNYNEKTAKLYTDLSLITADPEIGRDATDFFLNMSLSNLRGEYRALWIAPNGFKQNILRMIDGEIAKARVGKPCGVMMKCNSMTDRMVMEKLAEASKAKVPIKLVIRGICCLLPGVPGETDNIEIISIVGRFLEHSRIYCFGAGEETAVYIGSGDMMTRNTDKRVEIAAPVRDAKLKKRLVNMMDILLRDNVKAREMHSDGSYSLRTPNGQKPLCAQEEFILMAQAAAPVQSGNKRFAGAFLEKIRQKLPFLGNNGF